MTRQTAIAAPVAEQVDPELLVIEEIRATVDACDDPRAAARQVLDAIRRDELQQLLAEHGARLVDMPQDMAERHPGALGWVATIRGRITLVLPADQDPRLSLDIARTLLAKLAAKQVTA